MVIKPTSGAFFFLVSLCLTIAANTSWTEPSTATKITSLPSAISDFATSAKPVAALLKVILTFFFAAFAPRVKPVSKLEFVEFESKATLPVFVTRAAAKPAKYPTCLSLKINEVMFKLAIEASFRIENCLVGNSNAKFVNNLA